MPALSDPTVAPPEFDECLRCGYDLRGIANDQPCPECGLLAQRSRCLTDDLFNSRPKWLRKVSVGVWLILLALVSPFLWQWVLTTHEDYVKAFFWNSPLRLHSDFEDFIGLDLAAILLVLGALMVTAREGFPVVDQADRKYRWAIRISSFTPLLAVLLMHVLTVLLESNLRAFRYDVFATFRWLMTAAIGVATIGTTPLPVLLFFHLRRIAKRAHSAHLAEHCTIVGIGTSIALAYTAIVMLLMRHDRELNLDGRWMQRSNSWIVVVLVSGVAVLLFVIWSFYLMVRFAITFRLAARRLRKHWQRDDRSAPVH